MADKAASDHPAGPGEAAPVPRAADVQPAGHSMADKAAGDAPAGPAEAAPGDDAAAADMPRDVAADGPVTPYWPRWAVQFHLRLVRAGCNPKIVAAVGEAGRKVLALQATCPACRRPGALSAWPWTSGMMFSACKSDEHCTQRQIHAALDAAAPLSEGERLPL